MVKTGKNSLLGIQKFNSGLRKPTEWLYSIFEYKKAKTFFIAQTLFFQGALI